MITISLDEQGNFEQADVKKNKEEEPLFIGGVIYDAPSYADTKAEKERIDWYLQAVCCETDTTFPADLHYNSDKENKEKVKRVKQMITETLPEFLQSGTCGFKDNLCADQLNGMSRRRGRYYIFCYMKYGTAIKQLEKNSTSILMREGYAGNLYIHMAEEIVGRLVFHNPIIDDIEKVRLDLAKRRVVLDKGSPQVAEYYKLGYRSDDNSRWEKKNQVSFVLTNPDVYRTALEREMMNTGKNRIVLEDFRVRSIYYDDDRDTVIGNNPYPMSFLYLTDFICSNLGFKADTSSPEVLVEDFRSKADALTGHADNLIYVYDDVDLIYKKAWGKLEEKDYFEVLRLIHQGKGSDSPYAEYYTKVWFERIKECLLKEKDVDAYGIALRKYFLLTHSNNLQQDELIDIYNMFEEMLGQMKLKKEDSEVLYDLYDAGTSAFCHIGDSGKARECFDQCVKYAKYVDVERYLRSRNKMAVFLKDAFLYDEALKIAAEDVSFQEELKAARELIFDKEETSKGYGIALSQKGQICASLHLPEGERVFLDALDQIEGYRANYMITLSYLLHYYIEMSEKEKYDKWAVEYFGKKKSLRDQFYFVIQSAKEEDQSDYNMSYAFYVFIKGLYMFHMKDLSDSLIEKLCDIKTQIYGVTGKKGTELMNDDPWENIYKYLALIALKEGEKEKAYEYAGEIRKAIINMTPTMDAICTLGELEFARASGDEESEKESLGKLESIFKENGYEVYDSINWEDPDSAYGYLKENVLNYMYS